MTESVPYAIINGEQTKFPSNVIELLPTRGEVELLRNMKISEIATYLSKSLSELGTYALETENLRKLQQETKLSPEMLQYTFGSLTKAPPGMSEPMFSYNHLMGMIKHQLGDTRYLDEWVLTEDDVYIHAESRGRGVSIDAGNNPYSSIIPEVWGVLTKHSRSHKMPSGDKETLKLLSRVYNDVDKDHPVARTFRASWWKGGTDEIEIPLFGSIPIRSENDFYTLSPGYAMAWGADSSVESVRVKIPFPVKALLLGQEYGITCVSKEILANDELRSITARGNARDISFGDQQLCFSNQVDFLENENPKDVEKYLMELDGFMEEELKICPAGEIPKGIRRRIKEASESAEISGRKFYGRIGGYLIEYISETPIEIGEFPHYRILPVYGIKDISETLRYANSNINNVAIAAPREKREKLREEFVRRGVKRIITPGKAMPSRPSARSWDNMLPLSELVAWKTDEY